MIIKSFFVGLAFLGSAAVNVVAADSCHPNYDVLEHQYVVGYGSLMEKASKNRTSPQSGANIPVLIKGFARVWNTRGNEIGFSTTYLGVVPQPDATMAAAIYRDLDPTELTATDGREAFYCRKRVALEQITLLVKDSVIPDDAQVWIYVNKEGNDHRPDEQWPIVQSYVDIFMNGCMQLEKLVTRPNFDFVDACVTTTQGWSTHWVNDRLYPRRAFIYEPLSSRIDQVLHKHLPKEFAAIRIE
jgi:hypothetical protein